MVNEIMKLARSAGLGQKAATGFDKIELSDSQENFSGKVVVCDVKLEWLCGLHILRYEI